MLLIKKNITYKIFFDTKDELEGMFSDSGSELGSEREWFDEFKHLLLCIIDFLIIFCLLCNNKD